MWDIQFCLVTETILLAFIFSYIGVSGHTTTTATSNTTAASVQTESSDNGRWLMIGIGAGALLVLASVIGAAAAYVIHRNKKKIHPHSDADSIYSSSETSVSDSRPTTASHIIFEPDDAGMSQPVTMTPFELRKLFVETFPFGHWQAGFDGHLRPRMTLDFVDPRSYDRSKIDEARFREKIFHYEMTETIASRPPSSTEMSRMSTSILPPPSKLGPLPEDDGSGGGANSDSGNHSISDRQL